MGELAASARAPAHDHGTNPWLVLVCMAQDVVAVGEGEAALGTAAG